MSRRPERREAPPVLRWAVPALLLVLAAALVFVAIGSLFSLMPR
ncbi:MAG TPA: hypothetical protein VJJ70_08600 [Anaerolineales bacterium]|nr:hypothetical protein [Anaerolineales bacterium]